MISFLVSTQGVFPNFHKKDQLAELIVLTKKLADAAYHPELFSTSFTELIGSFRLAAEFDHRISSENDQTFGPYPSLYKIVAKFEACFSIFFLGTILFIPIIAHSLAVAGPPDPPPEII